MWNHTTYDLLTLNTLKIQSFVACAVEMNLAWNLTGMDSVEDIRVAGML